MSSQSSESEPSEYLPSLAELRSEFQEDGFRFPTAHAVVAKAIGLFLKYVLRKNVRWDPDREGMHT